MHPLLLLLFAAGHVGLCLLWVNRLHATALPYWLLKGIDAVWYAVLLALPVVFGAAAAGWLMPTGPLAGLLSGYGWVAVAVGLVGGVSWVAGRYRYRAERLIVTNHTQLVDVAADLGRRPCAGLSTWLLSALPGNQVFKLSVHQKTLEVDGLPAPLAGLSIVHLSDLHFTGRTTRAFFERVVEQANRLDGDLLVISGDIIDKAHCLDWLTDVLGRLEARCEKFFILGNHELRLGNEPAVRKTLESVGFVDLGGRWRVTTVKDWPIAVAGNELPWFAPAAAAREIPAQVGGKRVLRVAVSHSPDQIHWARAHQFDLMLAGHTHGGQIRLPLLGPVFSPSRYGVRFASGTFYCPPTLLHVSRGLSGTQPLRFGCPPELTKLVLQPKNA